MRIRDRRRGATGSTVAVVLVLAMALAACGGDDTEDAASGGDPAEGAATDSSETAAPDEAETEAAAATDGDPGAGDCAVDAATVSSITGVEMVFANTSTAIDDGLTCIFSDASEQTMAMASATVGSWDGDEATAEATTTTTTEHLGEPTGRPDLGDLAWLWNAEGGATHSLTVFAGDQYVTATVDSVDASAGEREAMLVALYEAAVG